MQPRISMITRGVRDLAESVRFYETGLGFPRMESPPEVAFFPLKGSWLALHDRRALAEDATVSPEGRGFEGFTLSHNVASEAEVENLMRQAHAAGATLARAAKKTVWGGYARYLQDPDGHLWEIAHNPHFRVGPRDEDAS